MSNIIVFEGRDEVVIATAANVNAIIREWFLEGGRCLDDYDIFIADGLKGFKITTQIRFDDHRLRDFNVVELMPHDLRDKLVSAELLDPEAHGLEPA